MATVLFQTACFDTGSLFAMTIVNCTVASQSGPTFAVLQPP